MSSEPRIEDVLPSQDEVADAVSECCEALPEDFLEQWQVFSGHSPQEIAERVRLDFANEPDERREILVAYLANRLGYSRYFNWNDRLTSEPLWDILRRKSFDRLSTEDLNILWMVAGSTRLIRSYLEPRASLAAIALWRGGSEERSEAAAELLRQKSLPSDEKFLYDLTRVLAKKSAEEEAFAGKQLIDLVRLQLDAGFHEVVAWVCGLYFVRIHDPWYTGTVDTNLKRACLLAAQSDPYRHRAWLDLMADATVAGGLTHEWLEAPMGAAIRLAIADPERERKLRNYRTLRRFDASNQALRRIYQTQLRALDAGDARVGSWLLDEVARTAVNNPTRATNLLEMVVAATHSGSGSEGARLANVLDTVQELDPVLEQLCALYVRCYVLERHAVAFVARFRNHVDWSKFPEVTKADRELYLVVGDYDYGFRDETLIYAGVKINHTDKDLAAHVRYFHEKRRNPNTVTGVVMNFATPTDWLATNIVESEPANAFFETLMTAFEARAIQKERTPQVVKNYRSAGVALETLEDIYKLPGTQVGHVARRNRHTPLMIAAGAGAISGALAPTTMGMSTVLDAPFVMKLVAEITADACWYYGFDPADDPQLPITILAVALSGSQPASLEPEQVHARLHSFLVRKSIIMAAIAQGKSGQVLGSSIMSFMETYQSSRSRFDFSTERLVRWIKREEDSWQKKLFERASNVALPAAEGLIGAALNVALVYDVSESAEAILIDRLLAQKYPDWKKRW